MWTKARFKIGKRYFGKKDSFTAQGYVIFKEWDASDGKYYYWEEWELTGFSGYDSWVEYDHYSRNVTVYEPVKAPEKYEVTTLSVGQPISVTLNNQPPPTTGTIKEIGTGKVVRIKGKMSYQLFSDDVMHYAEVSTGTSTVISIEDYRQTGDTDYDYYVGRVLDKNEQKAMFGKVVAPFGGGISLGSVIMTIIVLGICGIGFIPRYETVCTTRTIPTTQQSTALRTSPATQSTINSSSSSTANQDCQRVRVYGGGGSGVGK